MHEAVREMLNRYRLGSREDYINALREILQNVALFGLWRGKFFEKAVFYGGSALRILYGLDRYSEDLDFSLLEKNENFSLSGYGEALCREVRSFGFQAEFESFRRSKTSAIESAFLKANTSKELIVIEAPVEILRGLHPARKLKIKLEVDTDPPGGFSVENRYVLQPVPFPVRVCSLPDLFAGKLHAILCRMWRNRVKGRDWYDLVWYAGRYPAVRISHLESRMRQTGDYEEDDQLRLEKLLEMLKTAITKLDIKQAREEVLPFVKDHRLLEVWSRDFFRQIISRITVSPDYE